MGGQLAVYVAARTLGYLTPLKPSTPRQNAHVWKGRESGHSSSLFYLASPLFGEETSTSLSLSQS